MATILFVVPRFHTNLWFAVRALREAGHRVEIAVDCIAETEDHSYVVPTIIGPGPTATEVAALLDRTAPDLLLVRARGILRNRFHAEGRRRGCRVLRYDQRPASAPPTFKTRLRIAFGRWPAHRITPVPGLDPSMPRASDAIYLPFPVAALPHGDPARNPDGLVRILCVGKLRQARKNHALLVSTLRALDPVRRGFTLTLAGSTAPGSSGSSDANHAALAAQAAVEPWLSIQEDVPFHRMADLYAGHDICVLPSIGEPLGTAPLEGMAYGAIPVISTRAGTAGLIVDSETGLRVDMHRDGALGAAMQRLLDDPPLRARLSTEALRYAGTELSPGRFVARIEELLP